MTDPLLHAWDIHNRLSRDLLRAIPESALEARIGGRGRTIGAIFGHMHNNRLAWLEPAAADLATALSKVSDSDQGNRAAILAALDESTRAVNELLNRSLQAGGKVKAFGGHAATFLAYLIAHDSYHHGEIGLILQQNGFKLEKAVAYGLWNWK